MIRNLKQWAIVGAIVVGGVVWVAPAQAQRTAEARQAMERFIDTTCHVGEGRAVGQEILAYSDLLEAEFTVLLLEGPDEDMLARHRGLLNKRWARRQAFLNTDPDLGLGVEQLSIVAGLSKSDYLDREIARFKERCRGRAAMGLAILATPAAVDTLREMSQTGDEEIQIPAERAMDWYLKPSARSGWIPEERRLRAQRSGFGKRNPADGDQP
jgi:hypothetical protein